MLYELPGFEYLAAATSARAVSLLREHGEKAAVIAGATDLLGLLKDRVEGPALKRPEVLVDIRPAPELGQVSEGPDGLAIGAAVTLSRLAESEAVRRRFPALCQAAGRVGTTQLRNMGTLGGNLCQRPRCLYFRHRDFLCFKKGGKRCFAVTGEHRDYHAILRLGRCVMAHPSDTAPALLALNAAAVVAGPDGEQVFPLRELFLGPDSLRETALRGDQLLKEVRLPLPGPGTRQLFLKQGVRHAADFALASVAVAAELADGVCREVRLVLGGVAPLPLEAEGAEAVLRGRRLDGRLAAEAAEAALAGARPLPMNRYKVDLARALVRRALERVAASA
jgi:xanthine dehydrogenase YagS FAD-binding subunit